MKPLIIAAAIISLYPFADSTYLWRFVTLSMLCMSVALILDGLF